MAVVKRINELTKDFAGMRVPVKVIVDVDKKTFEVEVGTPTTAALIIREIKKEKGAHSPGKETIGNLTVEQIIKIAMTKRKDIRAKTLKGVIKTVLGTALSMGVSIEGKSPKEVQRELDQGVYDDVISKYEGVKVEHTD